MYRSTRHRSSSTFHCTVNNPRFSVGYRARRKLGKWRRGGWWKRGRYVEARSVRKWRGTASGRLHVIAPCATLPGGRICINTMSFADRNSNSVILPGSGVRVSIFRARLANTVKRKTPLDIAGELKLISWQGRILVSCAVPSNFHVCRTCIRTLFAFFFFLVLFFLRMDAKKRFSKFFSFFFIEIESIVLVR